MATLGDSNPNLYKKSRLQLENEARAQQQAQQQAVNTQSKDYIGGGADISKINAMQSSPRYEPGADLRGIQENSYMGPSVTTMGAQNPNAFKQTQLQQENEARRQQNQAEFERMKYGTPAQAPQSIPGESDTMRQNRARNESMVNAGITPYQGGQEAQYDKQALAAQSGYGKTYGGRLNIAPELFTNRVASKVGVDTKKQILEKNLQTAIQNRSTSDTPESYQALQDAQNAYSQYQSGEGVQKQAEIEGQRDQLAGREASELAQNLGNMGNTGQQQPQGYGIPSTGDAIADMNIAMSNQMMRENEQLINDDKIRNDNLLRNQLINSYMQTNISDLGYNKDALNKMTTEQLMSLGSAEGLDMSTAVKDKLSAFGKLQIENEKLNRDFELADVEMTRRQMERQLGRSITEQEDFNTQQDTKLRRMLGMFGGGKVQDLAGNMAVMDAQQKGITALADLRADYGDRLDSIGRTYNKINSSHALAIKGIEYETNNAIETAFVGLQNKIDGYITAGVTNEKELNKVAMQGKKEFLKTYMEETSKGADRIQKQNETMFNQVMKLQEAQREEDKNMSSMYGVIFNGGKPVKDQNGMEVPTFDNMKFMREGDKLRSEQEGIIYENGAPKLDSRGRTIPTLTARKFEQDVNQFEQNYGLNVAKFNQDAQQFGMNYALAQQKFAQDSTMDNAKFMMDADKNGYDVSLVGASSTSFNGANAKYSPVATPEGSVQFNIRTGTVPPNGREQCGEFVNDALGMKIFGNGIEQKRTKITTQVPNAGSAFVQSTQGPYGHVGLIEAVSGTDALGRPTALRFVDSNYGENGVVQRGIMTISYDKKGNPTYTRNGKVVRIDGFTDGILPSVEREQARTGDSQFGPQRPEKTITGESARIGQQYGPERPVGSYKAEAPYQAPAPQQPQFQVGNMLLTKRAGGGQQQIISDPKQRFDLEFKLAGDFDTDTKAARTAFTQKGVLDNAFAKAEQDVSSGKSMNASSQAIVIAFNKILDPTSVVREGEYARSAEGQAYLTAMQGKVQQIQQGGAGLTIDSLRDLKETADRFMQGYESSIKDKAQQTEMFAKNYGLNTENIFTPNAKSILKSLNQSSARDQARQALSSAGYDTSDASIDLYLKNQ